MSQLFLIRHGQASFFAENYDQLSDLGMQQSKILGRAWSKGGFKFDYVWSGTLERQIGTAELVGQVFFDENIFWPKIISDSKLNEYPAEEIMTSLGKHLINTNENVANLLKKYEESETDADRYRSFHKLLEVVLAEWVRGDYKGVDLHITWEDWSNGVRNSLLEIIEKSGNGKMVAVFTSGGPIGVSVQTALDAPDIKAAELNWRIYNGSVTKYTFDTSRISLDQFNDVSHLPNDLLTYR